jgi:uncharacterized repeat protein (TIGR03803 family)
MKVKYLLILLIVTFSIKINAQFSTLVNADGPNFFFPNATPISDGTHLYVVTAYDGLHGDGTIFKILPDGTGYSRIFDFDDAISGKNPSGSLFFDGTFLYGMTNGGGINSMGVIFKIKPDGTMFSKLFDFDGTNGGYPYSGHLISDGTYLYGMTSYGGMNYGGLLFKIKTDGTGFTHVLDFSDTLSGKIPFGSLFYDGTFLYGMTEQGGSNNGGNGTIFKIQPDGTNYSRIFNFSGLLTGGAPEGSLISDGMFLYGMTKYGGANDDGAIFKIMPDGTSFSVLYNFLDSTSGSYPRGSLVYDGTFLYGVTLGGGGYFYDGTIFKILPNGNGYSVLHGFTGTPNGGSPSASLFYDGTFFYGTTSEGGAPWSNGTVFKFKENPSSATESVTESNFNVYPNPSVDGNITLTFNMPNEGNIDVHIFTTEGKLIYSNSIFCRANSHNELPVGLNEISTNTGMYILEASTSDGVFRKKIIVMR